MSVKSGSNEGDRSNSIGLDDLDLNSAIEEVSDDGFTRNWQRFNILLVFIQIKLNNNTILVQSILSTNRCNVITEVENLVM